MAGIDQDIQGEAWAAKGTKIGYLSQQPELDVSKDVRGNVEEALKDQRRALERFNDIAMKFAEPMDDDAMNKLPRARVAFRSTSTATTSGIDNKIAVAWMPEYSYRERT